MIRPQRDSASGRAYLDLQNRARREGRRTQDLLTMYIVERWLARLTASPYANDFILKGGVLLAALGNRRPTVDADALARGMRADERTVADRVVEIAARPDPDDGVMFLTDTIRTAVIRDDALYSGVRVTMDARLGTANLKLKLDINFGDPVTPGPQIVELPALRPNVAPVRLLGYPIETVLAEKLTTAIDLGAASTRVRDWADIYRLSRTHDLSAGALREALEATAGFRNIELRPVSAAIGNLVSLRSATYTAYRRGLGVDGDHLPAQFHDLVTAVTGFADPLLSRPMTVTSWHQDRAEWTG